MSETNGRPHESNGRSHDSNGRPHDSNGLSRRSIGVVDRPDQGAAAGPRLRIALLAPPMEPVPPIGYGGTERVVAALADELTNRGHDVTLYAAGDSRTKARLVPTIPQSLWTSGYRGDVSSYMLASVAQCWRDAAKFDIVHSHAEVFGLPFARYAPVPVVSTMHGRLDQAGAWELLEEFRDVPLVAISESQKRWSPEANWVGVVHNGLLLDDMPFSPVAEDYLLFVGRVAIEKGIDAAIELANRTGSRLKIAAKMIDPPEIELYAQLVEPSLEDGRIEFLGEVGPAQRDPLYARARATLVLSAWPEPFGLVAIESLAAGTPVIARRSGALPEFIVHGEDGFLVDDVAEAELALKLIDRLDRTAIRERALERFGAPRMAAQYERIYRRVIAQHKEHVVPALHSLPHGEDREEYRTNAPLERRGPRLEGPAAPVGKVAREP